MANNRVVINSLLDGVQRVKITDLKPHPKNYNMGNVDAIARSLQDGQYKAITVQKSTMHICAGNHTWLAARQLGWTHIDANLLDIDDDEAERILVKDNRLAALAEVDDQKLAELIADMKVPTNLGYTDVELDGFKDMVREATASIEKADQERKEWDEKLRKSKTFSGSPLGEEPDGDDDDEDMSGSFQGMDDDDVPKEGKPTDKLMDAEDELTGAVRFKEMDAFSYEGVGTMDIPKLKPEMVMSFDELPDKLESWAGSATKDWPDPDQWWLYNWKIDSTSGMLDVSKCIVSFYAYDEYFEDWWFIPEKYVSKCWNSGVRYIVTPDFSMERAMPKALSVYQVYRSRALGRYFQECGFKIIPNLEWVDGDMDFLDRYVLKTLPRNLPMIAIQMQTIDPKEVHGGIEHYTKQIQHIFDYLKPQSALIYASKIGRDVLKNVNIECPVRVLGTRLEKLAEANKKKKRIKKATL